MSDVTTLEMTSSSPEQTEQLAAEIGAQLRGGEVIELISDLGGGKTTFTRGLVRATGSGDKVGSPTFTLSKEYAAPGFTVVHFDFYRLQEAGIVGDELAEVLGDPGYVTVVEWGDIVQDVLPEGRLAVRFSLAGDEARIIAITCPPELAYLMEGVK
jgi:tRNA threonylcarbamoyladenosine biosynthesis protein TsaE